MTPQPVRTSVSREHETRSVQWNEPLVSGNRSVERACLLLDCFELAEPELTLAQLSGRSGLPKPTTHRLAASLVAAGFMSQGQDGRYRLGFKLLELGAVVREHLDIVAACSPAMRAIAEATGESVLLARAEWDTDEVVLVQRIDSAHALSVLSPIGRRSKLAPGCLGRALLMGLDPASAKATLDALEVDPLTVRTQTDKQLLLAELDEARKRGYAFDHGEYLPDVSGVAVPVISEGGRPLGALGVVGPSTRIRGEIDRISAALLDIAAPLRTARLERAPAA